MDNDGAPRRMRGAAKKAANLNSALLAPTLKGKKRGRKPSKDRIPAAALPAGGEELVGGIQAIDVDKRTPDIVSFIRCLIL